MPELLPALSRRERAILVHLALDRSTAWIARELGLSPKTVRNYTASMYAKLQVGDRAAAVAIARDIGLV